MIDYRVTSREDIRPLLRAPGPLMRRCQEEVEEAVAKESERLAHRHLAQVLRHPTGYYQSHVYAERAGGDWELSDHGVIYGPWLEGVGSRNAPVTRFKGYATFRRVAQLMERQAGRVADRIVDRVVRRYG